MSDIHYFQRYSQKENVVTNNTLLLLSRLQQESPRRFEDYMVALLNVMADDFKIGAQFVQQESNRLRESTPDGIIKQDGFKIVVETKLNANPDRYQLQRHLSAFTDQQHSKLQLLLLIDQDQPSRTFVDQIKDDVKQFNKQYNAHVLFHHVTFKQLIDTLESILSDYDFVLQELLEDYRDFADSVGLLPNYANMMRAVVAGKSFDMNLKYGIYFDPADRGYSKHGYIGLYKNKAVKAIGKITHIVEAEYESEVDRFTSNEQLTEHQAAQLKAMMLEAKRADDWPVDIGTGHKFFFVEKFYTTDYKKTTKYPIQRAKFFDLVEVLGTESLPPCLEIADQLKPREWGVGLV